MRKKKLRRKNLITTQPRYFNTDFLIIPWAQKACLVRQDENSLQASQ